MQFCDLATDCRTDQLSRSQTDTGVYLSADIRVTLKGRAFKDSSDLMMSDEVGKHPHQNSLIRAGVTIVYSLP